MAGESKRDLIRRLQADLAREIGVLRQAAAAAREAATHEEARPENDKDTRAIEAGYLAGAQAARVRDLEGVANALEFIELRAFGPDDGIAVSAVIELRAKRVSSSPGGARGARSPTVETKLDRDGERSRYFVAPQGGGMKSTFDGEPIQVITPRSPIGRAVLGKTVGDVVELQVDRGAREYEVVAVE